MDDIRKFMRQITRMAQSYTAKRLKDTGLSPGQMQALRIITFHKSISQQSLADHLGIDKAAVARIISALEGKGYVHRVTGGDKRVKLASPTSAGESVMHEFAAHESKFYEHIFQGVGDSTMAEFERALVYAHSRARQARDCGFYSPEGKEEKPPCT